MSLLEVNLIPHELLLQNRVFQRSRWLFCLLVLGVVVCVGLSGICYGISARSNSAVMQLDVEVADVERQLADILLARKERARSSEYQQRMVRLRRIVALFIELLPHVVPEAVSLIELHLRGGMLELSGVAESLGSVSELVGRLQEQCPRLHPAVERTSRATLAGREIEHFTVRGFRSLDGGSVELCGNEE